MSKRNRGRRPQAPKSHRHLRGAVDEIVREREIPLPERGPVNPTPDFIPHTLRVEQPQHAEHYRATHIPIEARYAFVTLEFMPQLTCEHPYFHYLTRFGHAVCSVCTARAWSPYWVAAGLYGLNAALADTSAEILSLDGEVDLSDGTSAYIAEVLSDYEAKVQA